MSLEFEMASFYQTEVNSKSSSAREQVVLATKVSELGRSGMRKGTRNVAITADENSSVVINSNDMNRRVVVDVSVLSSTSKTLAIVLPNANEVFDGEVDVYFITGATPSTGSVTISTSGGTDVIMGDVDTFGSYSTGHLLYGTSNTSLTFTKFPITGSRLSFESTGGLWFVRGKYVSTVISPVLASGMHSSTGSITATTGLTLNGSLTWYAYQQCGPLVHVVARIVWTANTGTSSVVKFVLSGVPGVGVNTSMTGCESSASVGLVEGVFKSSFNQVFAVVLYNPTYSSVEIWLTQTAKSNNYLLLSDLDTAGQLRGVAFTMMIGI